MGVHLDNKSDVAILSMSGSFFGDRDADNLNRSIRKLIAEGNVALIIDLGGVHHMNSAALGVLVATHANYVKRGGRVILTQVDKHLENLIVITRLVRVFEIGPTVSDALHQFGVPA